ncbi:MFS transporter, DHA2 family, multidrug resistance protein [Plantibacter flavus]|uniref:DHA2 family multidrug resistance protein-like MFS transporter n=1 Tax=Plantibacter flavus TaxID=150123 RepID=A0A3N2C1Q8_9MICO|nr:MFS transporter [Plantibacter flavus]ROR81433.1 DHA2 family multidrug resistance protein-like MFS transporter [Plantibacter flavus]SMG13030.1 MFS transporter, DHA2 family, multidrug resistance protein [Plantibacter flavus]
MSTATEPTAVTAPRAGRRAWFALAVLMLPVLLVSVDNTVLNFALPAISSALTPSGTQLLWIVDIYPLVLAGLLVSMGSLGDRIGRRRLLLIGSIGFGVVSVAAAFAPSAELLIAARAALGFFGAMLMPSTLSLLRNIFLDRDQRRFAIAVWASGFAAGSALGPIVGGIILEHFAWGAVFLLAVPVLLPLVVLAPFLIPESKDPNPGRIDVPSILLILLTMTPLVFSIKHLAEAGFDVLTVVSMIVGVVSGILFIRRQLRLEHPLLDLSLFRRASFSGAVVINLLSVTALVGGLFFVSQHLQLVLGLQPLDAGLVLLPGLIVMIIAGLVIVPISKRVRPGIVVPIALVVSAVGYASIAITGGDVSALGIGLAFVALGLGIGSAETVSNELVIASAPPEKAGAASGVSETAYELGAVLGTATLGTVLTASYRSSVVLPDGLTAAQQQAAGETLGGAANVAEQLPGDLAGALMDSARHAFDSGVGVAAWIGVGLIVAAMLVAAIGLRRVR